ncbi:hypothetical protein ACCS79_03500 [Rhizobium johnstonii]|uniref:hypothetical protein n=1 Tax=Rhizobium johnstonii TaxID=3019933 RepID=UPI003F9EB433
MITTHEEISALFRGLTQSLKVVYPLRRSPLSQIAKLTGRSLQTVRQYSADPSSTAFRPAPPEVTDLIASAAERWHLVKQPIVPSWVPRQCRRPLSPEAQLRDRWRGIVERGHLDRTLIAEVAEYGPYEINRVGREGASGITPDEVRVHALEALEHLAIYGKPGISTAA